MGGIRTRGNILLAHGTRRRGYLTTTIVSSAGAGNGSNKTSERGGRGDGTTATAARPNHGHGSDNR